jgi:acetyl-CoA carboxylase carboxyl transferase beta subunit/acetyl-CoA carboxylase carboxyl transferase alpha subunit
VTQTPDRRPVTGLAPDPADAADPGWLVCAGCGEMVYRKRLDRNLSVCPDCGHHHRLTAPDRIATLLDEGRIPLPGSAVASPDTLGFVDTKPYPERRAAASRQTGLDEGVVLVSGTIGGHPLIAAVMDFRFLGGSLGSAVGELITRAAEAALDRRLPLLIVSSSGGARMQEGIISLMQMAKTSAALGQLDEAGILTLSLITDPTYGGVAASFSTLCDVIVAEPGARLGFAGPRVIEQTIRQILPDGFQTAEFLLEHGLIDLITPRRELRATLARLLAPASPEAGGPEHDDSDIHDSDIDDSAVVERDYRQLPDADAWATVQQARDLGRPTVLTLLRMIFTDFTELHGDRLGGDCPAIVAGLARLAGTPVMVIGQEKGVTLRERTARNYGMPTPPGYRKAARLMRTAAKLGLPVITMVDTPGAYPGIEAEEQGQSVAIAENIKLMTALPVPVVCVITSEGGSGGALALAVADEVLICANGIYSVISPEGCASILWHDARQAPAAASALRLDARQLLALGVVDGAIREPEGGNQSDHEATAQQIRTALSAAVSRLSRLDADQLVARRRERFRAFGTQDPAPAPATTKGR